MALFFAEVIVLAPFVLSWQGLTRSVAYYRTASPEFAVMAEFKKMARADKARAIGYLSEFLLN